mmetsp:Transcript_13456/g.22155  ORF Transcript_13456/g.22155 Transcript_13456/m.22155 type:complete len:227 (+) Transcript_13456:82-762(+)
MRWFRFLRSKQSRVHDMTSVFSAQCHAEQQDPCIAAWEAENFSDFVKKRNSARNSSPESAKRTSTISTCSSRSHRTSLASMASSCSSASSSPKRQSNRSWTGSSTSRSPTRSQHSKRSSVSSSSSGWSSDGLDIPDIVENRDEWFTYWNDNFVESELDLKHWSQKQVIHVLRRTFRSFDKHTVETVVKTLWPAFDEHQSGLVGYDDLMKPQMGLIDMAHMQLCWNQ